MSDASEWTSVDDQPMPPGRTRLLVKNSQGGILAVKWTPLGYTADPPIPDATGDNIMTITHWRECLPKENP